MGAKKRDLKPGDFPQNLKWSDSEATPSLELLYQYVNNECNRAAGWYFVKKKTMKTLGYIFRVGSILALAFAGVIPILGEIFEKGDVPGISPAWSTLFLAIAGVFLSLDRFGGYTSGWIRYIRTAQALNRLQSNFRIEWESQRLLLQGGQTDSATVGQAIQKCRDFLAQVNSIVGAETDEWAKDFQRVLAELERKSKENEDNSF
ncbi:MAG: SLATT domain-containing protein [Desulfobacterales bacterium]|jgi:hypothetical protein